MSDYRKPADYAIDPESAAKAAIESARMFEESLSHGVFKISFIKKNGEVRKMRATRDMDIISNTGVLVNVLSLAEDSKKFHKTPTSTVTVWDLDKNEFRAFKAENLICIEQELSNGA